MHTHWVNEKKLHLSVKLVECSGNHEWGPSWTSIAKCKYLAMKDGNSGPQLMLLQHQLDKKQGVKRVEKVWYLFGKIGVK